MANPGKACPGWSREKLQGKLQAKRAGRARQVPAIGGAAGEKRRYGSWSERGTRVAALFCSLIESAKLCGVEPRAYLGEAAPRAIRSPGAVTLARDLK